MQAIHIDPWVAVGVVAATAATDAIYVLFTAAVAARRSRACGELEQCMVSALLIRGH